GAHIRVWSMSSGSFTTAVLRRPWPRSHTRRREHANRPSSRCRGPRITSCFRHGNARGVRMRLVRSTIVVGTLAAILAACGSDAPRREVAPKTTVFAKVFDRSDASTPVSGTDVVFSDASGVVLGQARTDALGR